MSSSISALKMNKNGINSVPSLQPPSNSTSSHKNSNEALSAPSGYSVISDWTRGELIGRGGFGNVYLAIDRNSGALFAVNFIPYTLCSQHNKYNVP